MKKFLIRFFLFLLLFCILGTSVILGVNNRIDSGNYFNIDKNISALILGNSHPECAFNDSVMPGFKNYAQSGESYFYTYSKLKKLLKNNPQVKTVFLEFSNVQITQEMDKWTWGYDYITERYSKYVAFMSLRDQFLLAVKNPAAVLNSVPLALKSNVNFLRKKKTDYISDRKWGGYVYIDRFKADSFINLIRLKDPVMLPPGGISNSNIFYLKKIVSFCKTRSVKLFFTRTPTHLQYTCRYNENTFAHIRLTEFPDTEFLDFNNYPFQNAEFGDLEHLNYRGAKIFSQFFYNLVAGGILTKESKQNLINKRIDSLNPSLIDTMLAEYKPAKTT